MFYFSNSYLSFWALCQQLWCQNCLLTEASLEKFYVLNYINYGENKWRWIFERSSAKENLRKNIQKFQKIILFLEKNFSFDLRKTAVRRKTYDTVPESDIRDLKDFMLVKKKSFLLWILELENRVRVIFLFRDDIFSKRSDPKRASTKRSQRNANTKSWHVGDSQV